MESPEPPQVCMTEERVDQHLDPPTTRFISLHHTHTRMHTQHAYTESPKAQKKPLPSEIMGHPVSNPIPIRGGLHIFSLLPTTAGSHHSPAGSYCSPTLFFLDHKSKNRNSSLRISRGKGEGEMAATKKLANKR